MHVEHTHGAGQNGAPGVVGLSVGAAVTGRPEPETHPLHESVCTLPLNGSSMGYEYTNCVVGHDAEDGSLNIMTPTLSATPLSHKCCGSSHDAGDMTAPAVPAPE